MATLLEKIVDERVGQTLVGTVSVAVDRIAEEIAREALGDETFRRALRELVRVRSQKLLDQLLQMVVATDDHRNAQRSDSNLPIG
jgi:homoaconitase/3-isopropylmalate dehydratase large subunit